MNANPSGPPDIRVEIIVRGDCRGSQRVLRELKAVQRELPGMQLETIDINDLTGHRRSWGGITPAIWVNGDLWFLGSYSKRRFLSRMHLLRT